ncbi:hypothetical protein [Lysinibacillus sp. LK3]|uniref:hypothetical protein n=1 Tax=Lysinibacillus sp. LK3 TaxID=1628207 RepID=UPI00069EE441|nr:hypothetical protein [Lysinibacillus sp. LK3]
MSNNHGFNKLCNDCEGCEDCKSFSKFRVSSCPNVPTQEEPVQFIPAYGSIYNVAGGNPTINPNVNFDTVGPSSGTTPSTIDDSITVNSQGVYTVTFTIELRASSGGISNNIIFRLTINGTPLATKQIEYQTFVTAANIEVDLVSRTDQLALNQGDVIRVAIVSSTGLITYDNAALVVTKVA